MNNPVQWFYLGIVTVAVILSAAIFVIAKPLRLYGPGWQGLSWSLAVAIPFGVGCYLAPGIPGSGGELRGMRVESLDDALEAIGPIPLLILFFVVVVGAVMGAVHWRRFLDLPDRLDASALRRLVRGNTHYDQLVARYGSDGAFPTAELNLAASLGLADREAQRLRSTIVSYVPRFSRGHTALWERATQLEYAVLSARTSEDARRTLAEMRSLMARLESGERVRS